MHVTHSPLEIPLLFISLQESDPCDPWMLIIPFQNTPIFFLKLQDKSHAAKNQHIDYQ